LPIARAIAGVFLILLACAPVAAHETRPAIADITVGASTVTLDLTLALEPLLVGIDLGTVSDTNDSPRAAQHDALRALPPDALADRLRAAWSDLSGGMRLRSDGAHTDLRIEALEVPDGIPDALPRDSRLRLVATLPDGGAPVTFGWAATFGPLILRQTGDGGYTGYLTGGADSPPLARAGQDGQQAHGLTSYVVAGYRHIIPAGADHILFVLGLFFYAPRWRPLLGQVTAFTAAHTLTLGLATFGLVPLPRAVVEPLIAASIIWIAVENIANGGANPTPVRARLRLAVVAGFGLLHGLGFAAMLAELGLPDGARLAALAAFNLGVELGQLAVLAAAFLVVGIWYRDKPWYVARIARPASALIGLAGVYWLVVALP
jgi:hypothetical protein